MTPIGFEHLCADILHKRGWSARTTKGSGDQGVDILAEKWIVIQSKYYSRPAGNKAVQEAFAGKAHMGAKVAAVVSNTSFTAAAVDLTRSAGVYLLHTSDLERADKLFGSAFSVYEGWNGRILRRCSSCNAQLRLPMHKSGKVRCPMCKSRFYASTY